MLISTTSQAPPPPPLEFATTPPSEFTNRRTPFPLIHHGRVLEERGVFQCSHQTCSLPSKFVFYECTKTSKNEWHSNGWTRTRMRAWLLWLSLLTFVDAHNPPLSTPIPSSTFLLMPTHLSQSNGCASLGPPSLGPSICSTAFTDLFFALPLSSLVI